MISEPTSQSREDSVADLEEQKRQFFAAGKSIRKMPTGLSGEDQLNFGYRRQKQFQVERAKLAPMLRAYADAGRTIEAAAIAMKIKCTRAQRIAKENDIIFRVFLSRP